VINIQYQNAVLDEAVNDQPTAIARKPVPIFWMVGAFAVALVLAAIVVAIGGVSPGNLRMALRVTARWAFLLFWVAYTGRALATLFGPVLTPLARRGREFGLAYASAMLIHIGIVLWIYQLTSRAPLSGVSLLFFLIGIAWTYLLAVFSFGRLAEDLGPTGWRLLRVTAVNYILFAFGSDFVPALINPAPGHHGLLRTADYIFFASMTIAAPLLVVAASARRRLEVRYGRAQLRPAIN
jgi:hypothetical protein